MPLGRDNESKSLGYYITLFVVLIPVYTILFVPFAFMPVSLWPSALFFAGIVTLILVGCSIGGGYDAGCIWHYHGTPEAIYRPDVENLTTE